MRSLRAAFTLVELLTVVAIMALLGAMLVPALGGARTSVQRAQTQARFGQWAAAMELYRQEYGFYPRVTVDGRIATERFVAELTGRTVDGSPTTGDAAYDNRRGLTFLALSTDDFDPSGSRLADALGNTEIGLRVDVNRDGRIDGTDAGAWVPVSALSGRLFAPGDVPGAVPPGGVRTRVAIYSAGAGRTAEDMILSWR